MADKKRLVVIDGKAVFYRGYYAMPHLSKKDGTPTGGVYGFAVMALEVLKKMKPDYVCVAWDKPKTNIRRRLEIYPKYKANRKPAPPDFYEQIPVLMDMLKAFNMPLYEIDDHEADDIMATFSHQARDKGYETIMVTGDHDLLQAVSDDTVVAIMRKGLTNIDYFNPERFKDKYQMTPEQFIDYKSMRGDASDNIPGIAGVGDKTATNLIKTYGSVKEVYKHLEDLRPKMREKFENGRDAVDIARQLVELEFNVPMKLNWQEADVTNVVPSKVVSKLRELEFVSLLRQLPPEFDLDSEEEVPEEASVDLGESSIEHVVIETVKDLNKLKSSSKEIVVHALSADSWGRQLQYLLISDSVKKCYSIVINNELTPELVIKKVSDVFGAEVAIVGHNVKEVYKIFLHSGYEPGSIAHDTSMAAFLINSIERDHKLPTLALAKLGVNGGDIEDIQLENIVEKAQKLTAVIWALYEYQKAELVKLPEVEKLAKEIEWPVLPVLARMEAVGMKLDTAYLAKMSKELGGSLSDLQQEIYGHAGEEFNIASTQQLSKILFETLELPSKFIKKTKSGFSTAASELDKLRDKHDIINLITEFRELSKLKSTYVDALPVLVDENSKLHTTFSVDVTPTGRLSSHDPNLQNIPVRSEMGKKIRKAFVAAPGNVFISADYSQFELRLAAVLANDTTMIEAFNRDVDIHTMTAAQLNDIDAKDVTKEQRYSAKAVNFGIMYGMSAHGLSVATGMTPSEAKDFITKYFELRKPLLAYIESVKKQAHDEGFVATMLGRRRPTPDVKSSNFIVRQSAERAAINMPIQGTEADLMKIAMIETDKMLPKDSKQILQIHDSIMIELPEGKADDVAAKLKKLMENVYDLPVKLSVDVSIGDNWGDL